MKNLIIYTICILFLTNCKEKPILIPPPIKLYNHSSETIYCYTSNGDYFNSPTLYPDTLLPSGLSELSQLGEFNMGDVLPLCPPSRTCIIFMPNWDGLNVIKSDTLSFFIINMDSLKTYGYETIAKTNNIIIRYDLSKKELKKLNYNVSFPPTEEMKDMHMSPSYSEFMKRYKFN